jgi:Holliday junction resolvase RusA-like endonuclease
MTTTFTVVGTPAPQGSKRARAIYAGRGQDRQFTGKIAQVESSTKVAPWREAVKTAAYQARDGQPPLDGAVLVTVSFYLARPRSHYRTGRNAHLLRDNAPAWPATKPDIDKLLRSTLDGLGEAGIFTDDARVASVSMSKIYAGPQQPLDVPGALISICSLIGARQ